MESLTVSKTRNMIMSAGKELFWKYGIRRVPVEEICLKASVSRMTFYKYFSNKNELVIKLLDDVYLQGMEQYTLIMEENTSYEEKVRKLILMKIESTNAISKEFLSDLRSEDNKDIYLYLNNLIKGSLDRMRTDFREASEKGEIRKGINPDLIIYFINKIYDLSADQELLNMFDSAQEMILELTNLFFYGIMPVKRKS